jgi:hypothetical protein
VKGITKGGRFVMALKDTCATMGALIHAIQDDLEKASEGNKAAAQRVRTTSIRLEKVAKLYRKESVAAAKSGVMGKMKKAKKQAKPKKAAAPKAKKAAAKKKPAAKAKKAVAKKPATAKRATAKLPKKRTARRR